MPVEVVADQIPGSIYVREDQVWFINVSDSRTLYCVGTDGSGCELLIPQVCEEFVTDGEWLYYLIREAGWALYKSSLNGKEEEKILHKEDFIWDILPYQGDIYWVDGNRKRLMRLNVQEEEMIASDVRRFMIACGQAYVMSEEKIRRVNLTLNLLLMRS